MLISIKNLFKIFLFLHLICSSYLRAQDVPVIVIAPSKSTQSISTVGTSVQVFEQGDLGNTGNSFLGDSLNSSATGLNFFQGVYVLAIHKILTHYSFMKKCFLENTGLVRIQY